MITHHTHRLISSCMAAAHISQATIGRPRIDTLVA
jgi:hypothetical protein